MRNGKSDKIGFYRFVLIGDKEKLQYFSAIALIRVINKRKIYCNTSRVKFVLISFGMPLFMRDLNFLEVLQESTFIQSKRKIAVSIYDQLKRVHNHCRNNSCAWLSEFVLISIEVPPFLRVICNFLEVIAESTSSLRGNIALSFYDMLTCLHNA